MNPAPAADGLPRQQLQLQQLRHMKRLATGLLLLMVLLFVLARRFESQHPLFAWVGAFAEAAMIGALADWFAVVALFRHPLGLPLPHTAIIPRNKGRIAENLGGFISGNFLRTELILQRIREFDPAARLSHWLGGRAVAAMLGGYGARALAYALQTVEDARVQRFLHAAMLARLREAALAPLAGRVLDLVVQDGRHQQLLDRLLVHAREMLAEEGVQEKIAELIAREFEGWRRYLMGMQVDAAIGGYSGKKLVAAVSRLIDEVLADPEHALRRRYDEIVATFIGRLKSDEAFRMRGDQLLARPELAAWLQDLWLQVRAWLERDLADPDSVVRTRLVSAIQNLGVRLQADAAMREWVNEQILAAARVLNEEHRESIGRFIASQVKAWDEDYMVHQFEINIGRDLQYIRINGTLIGGLAGVVIHALAGLIRV